MLDKSSKLCITSENHSVTHWLLLCNLSHFVFLFLLLTVTLSFGTYRDSVFYGVIDLMKQYCDVLTGRLSTYLSLSLLLSYPFSLLSLSFSIYLSVYLSIHLSLSLPPFFSSLCFFFLLFSVCLLISFPM